MLVLFFTAETSDSSVKTNFNLIVTITVPYKFCSQIYSQILILYTYI